MTRRGTLAYYLAAWVIGGFFISLFGWIADVRLGQPATASVLLTDYFFVLIFGAVDLLLFAFLLRRAARLWRTHNAVAWLLIGAVLAVGLLFALGEAADRLAALGALGSRAFGPVFMAVLAGPAQLRHSAFWQTPLDGATSAVVLRLVDRAFDSPPEQTSAPKPAI